MKKILLVVLGILYCCSLAYSASNEAGGDYAIPNVSYGKESGTGGIKALYTDSSGRLTVTLNELTTSRLIHDSMPVTTIGTALRLTTNSVSIKFVEIRAGVTNMGAIFVGNASVDKTNGYQLTRNATLRWRIDNLNKIYIDASTANDEVTFIAEPQ